MFPNPGRPTDSTLATHASCQCLMSLSSCLTDTPTPGQSNVSTAAAETLRLLRLASRLPPSQAAGGEGPAPTSSPPPSPAITSPLPPFPPFPTPPPAPRSHIHMQRHTYTHVRVQLCRGLQSVSVSTTHRTPFCLCPPQSCSCAPNQSDYPLVLYVLSVRSSCAAYRSQRSGDHGTTHLLQCPAIKPARLRP